MLVTLLFGENGILSKVLSGDMLVGLLPAIAEFGIDIRPSKFYETTIEGANFENAGIATWLANAYSNAIATETDAAVKYALENDYHNLTWAQVGKYAIPADYDWFPTITDTSTDEEKVDAFFAFLTDLLSPLNTVFSLILCGEDLTLFDELVLEGGEGYQTGLVVLLEMFGVGSVKLPDRGTEYQTVSMSRSDYLTYLFGTTDPESWKGDSRNWVFKKSPLTPLFTGLRALLIGDDAAGVTGILESPLTTILELLPNLAYGLYTYDVGDGTRTSNIAEAVKNLIAPVLELLTIVDPVLSKALELDVAALISGFLDIESTINEALSKALLKNEIDGSYTMSSFIDLGSIAVFGGDEEIYDTNASSVVCPGTITKFYRFNGHAGKTFITILRTVLNDDVVHLIEKAWENWYLKGDSVDTEAFLEAKDVAIGLVNRIKGTGSIDDGYPVDIIIGILVDLLTDYVPGTGVDMFYINLGAALDGAIDNAEAIIAKYGLEHNGYDWTTISTDENGTQLFTEEEVNETLDSLDIVIQKALPDILNILSTTGTLDLSSLGIEITDTSVGLFEILSALVSDLAFNDEMVTTIYDLLMGLLGGSIAQFLPIVADAGIDLSAANLYRNAAENSGLRQYMAYGITGLDTATGKVNGEDITWDMIKAAHSIQSYEYDENGNVVLNADGTVKYAYAQKDVLDSEGKPVKNTDGTTKTEDDLDNPITEGVALYTQKTNDAGEYLYTYTNADGEEAEYTSTIANLKSFAVKTGTQEVENEDGTTETVDVYKTYTLSPVYDETTAKWSFGFGATGSTFYSEIDVFIDALWALISPLESILVALFFGEETNTAVKLFDTLNIEGQDGYEGVMLPLLRGFGLDAILTYLDTNYVLDDQGNATTTTYLAALNAKRATRYGADATAIPNRLIKSNEGMSVSYTHLTLPTMAVV